MNLQKSKVEGRLESSEKGKERGNDIIILQSQKKRENNKNLPNQEGVSFKAYTYLVFINCQTSNTYNVNRLE